MLVSSSWNERFQASDLDLISYCTLDTLFV
jgi:hypothetical protein